MLRCQIAVRSVRDRAATVARQASSTAQTASRMVFCSTLSATTPASSAGSRIPIALAVVTIDSWVGPPPIRMTSQTIATTQTPCPNVLVTSATASRR